MKTISSKVLNYDNRKPCYLITVADGTKESQVWIWLIHMSAWCSTVLSYAAQGLEKKLHVVIKHMTGPLFRNNSQSKLGTRHNSWKLKDMYYEYGNISKSQKVYCRCKYTYFQNPGFKILQVTAVAFKLNYCLYISCNERHNVLLHHITAVSPIKSCIR
jgi:hypothetical protein